MKKIWRVVFLVIIIGGSFWAGSWYKRDQANKPEPSGVKSPVSESGNRSTPGADPADFPPGTIRVSSEKQQVIGVQISQVQKSPQHYVLRALGRVAADETRIYRINSSVEGWIRNTFDNATGSLAKKDELLATFYSPEFLGAQQAYIFALMSLDRSQATGKEVSGQVSLTKANIQQYKDQLRNLGMADLQIEEIGRTRLYSESINITSPVTGFILSRNVSRGEKFDKGRELYRIADLSRVWIMVDMFESEAQNLTPGTKVRVLLPYGKKAFNATVSRVLPLFDGTSRTLKVRLEADNPGYLLRPDMFVDVELPVNLASAIAIPADAVLDSGLKKTVFVDRGNGYFEPREVQTGWRFGNRVEIVEGLAEGERIVTSGNFLIDSESKLEMAASGMPPAVSKDPVCGQEVSPKKAEKAGRKSIFAGKTYYFDSDECKQQFDKAPTRFIGKNSQESPVEKPPPSQSQKIGRGHDHS